MCKLQNIRYECPLNSRPRAGSCDGPPLPLRHARPRRGLRPRCRAVARWRNHDSDSKFPSARPLALTSLARVEVPSSKLWQPASEQRHCPPAVVTAQPGRRQFHSGSPISFLRMPSRIQDRRPSPSLAAGRMALARYVQYRQRIGL